ncbi:ATP synthase subunit I [Tepidimonas charontis]|uniref:ATP synthase I chain n=1 Tax=Tepidimonas charontis TaxID=2267262 RepID=A0A554X3Z3_9BURK|nr:ATP synthase I chain [Tepidimonas charontis]
MQHPLQSATPVSGDGRRVAPGWDDDGVDEGGESSFKPLSPDEAAQWRQRHPALSVWHVVGWQALVWGLSVALTAALVVLWWPHKGVWVSSLAYGGAAALLPAALMAWGMTSSAWARWLRAARPGQARASLAGWLWWEGVKVLLTLALLWMAPRWIPDLSWPALVVGLVVVLKSYWLAWVARPAAPHRSASSETLK